MKFGIGQPMRRHEELRLITGRGRYTDDIILPRMTHAFVLRSPVAHAHITRIDAAAARRMPGCYRKGRARSWTTPCRAPAMFRLHRRVELHHTPCRVWEMLNGIH
jgi:hypothetical protein